MLIGDPSSGAALSWAVNVTGPLADASWTSGITSRVRFPSAPTAGGSRTGRVDSTRAIRATSMTATGLMARVAEQGPRRRGVGGYGPTDVTLDCSSPDVWADLWAALRQRCTWQIRVTSDNRAV